MTECVHCGCDTNIVPAGFPDDWRGLCPRCAFEAYAEGRISCPSREALRNVAAVMVVLGEEAEVLASGPGIALFSDPEAYRKARSN